MEKTQNQNNEINATIKAIDNGMLVLETLEDKQLIRWPLDKLPSSLSVGDPLAIKLETNCFSPLTSEVTAPAQKSASENERHKLLEELIN